jgi:TonB family protein
MYYLTRIAARQSETIDFSAAQQHFAQLLLNNRQAALISRSGREMASRDAASKKIDGMTNWADNFDRSIEESLEELPPTEATDLTNETGEIRRYSKEEFDDLRKSSAANRKMAMSALEREVESVGLLGVISSNKNDHNENYIQDLLAYASKNSNDLGTILSKLNSLEIPRDSEVGYLNRFEKNSASENFAGLRGGRRDADKELSGIVQNVSSLNQAQIETIARTIQYEEVKSSYLNKSIALTAKKPRTSHEVLKVVHSHMKTLQDCYRQELKNEPTLKGTIIVRFTVTPEGVVTNASLVSSTLNNLRLDSCILARICRRRNFPECDPSFGNMTYRQKFTFGT